MSSIIEGYNYDIFISYRQKDNKGDRWVSEFVKALKTELESTFKEEISVYFDINPHDGLLETHDVDASLRDKLKCLVFIPIISQTYCDSKSFAWEHEFVAFNKMAKEDKFGRDIKLAGGNVSSRILPVKIHDLDTEDKSLLENEIGGFIRGIEFIYKEPGVNRPLKPEDDEKKNLNSTVYRNQNNKVANAVKEIITALRKHDQHEGEVRKDIVITRPEAHKNPITKIIIASFVVLILILSGYFLIPKLARTKEHLEKSIAVLPFINDSPVDSNKYFINGIMEEVLNNLQKIRDFRVLSRTSTDQYKDKDRPTVPEIAKKLNVNYIVEGSGQKYGNKFVLRVQLLVAKNERHIWGKSYDRKILQTSDIINIQSEIAQAIAAELNAVITPDEKQLIEKNPTTNLTAYNFCQQGEEELNKCWGNYYKQDLLRAEELFRESLKYDSTFAKAYVGLAWVYLNKHYQEFYSSENSSLDTMFYLANKALSFDSQLSGAYRARGRYYLLKGLYDKAIDEFDGALKYNPNDYGAYYWKGITYESYSGDCIQVIDNISKAADRNKGKDLPFYLDVLGDYYIAGGFPDKAKYYYQEEYKLTRDSAQYLYCFAWVKERISDFEEALKLAKRANLMDSTKIISLGFYCYLPANYNDEAYLNAKRWAGIYEKAGDQSLINNSHRIGLAFWRVGKHKEAEYYFNQQIRYCEASIKNKRSYPEYGGAYYDLAATYAFLGDKAKAYKYLDEFDKMKTNMDYWVMLIKHDPLFDSIRSEEHFKRIEQSLESRCQAEHERVKKWLEENKML